MGTVITVTSGKGGTGKTTVTGGVASCLARLGKTVLCIDMDIGLRNLDISLGLSDRALMDFADVALGRCTLSRAAVRHPDLKELSLLTAPMSLPPSLSPYRVRSMLSAARTLYDYILIDCSPSLGYTTVNILTAADTVLIPVQCEYLALEGLSKLLNTIRKVKGGLNPGLDIEGFLLTMYMRNRLNNQVVSEVREHFGPLAYDTIIQRNIRLGEAPSHGKPVMLYDAGAVGSENYLALAREFLKRNRKRSK